MRRCHHRQSQTIPTFNVDGNKTAMFCKKHEAMFCKKHEEDGMVNVTAKCCAHSLCRVQAMYSADGSKKRVYCKQHADNGMVDINNERCSHALCATYLSFNVYGSTTPTSCKKRVDKAMVRFTSRKRCSRDCCRKVPSLNFAGSNTAVYCSQHAEEGMVDVRSLCCLHHSCGTYPSFNVAGTKTAAYCKRHAANGTVNIRYTDTARGREGKAARHSTTDPCTTGPVQSLQQPHAEALECIRPTSDGLVVSVKNCRKRARLQVDEEEPQIYRDHNPLKEAAGVQAVWMHLSKDVVVVVQPVLMSYKKAYLRTFPPGALPTKLIDFTAGQVPHVLSPVPLPRTLHDVFVGTASKKLGRGLPLTLASLPDEHQSRQSIKTKMELAVEVKTSDGCLMAADK